MGLLRFLKKSNIAITDVMEGHGGNNCLYVLLWCRVNSRKIVTNAKPIMKL